MIKISLPISENSSYDVHFSDVEIERSIAVPSHARTILCHENHYTPCNYYRISLPDLRVITCGAINCIMVESSGELFPFLLPNCNYRGDVCLGGTNSSENFLDNFWFSSFRNAKFIPITFGESVNIGSFLDWHLESVLDPDLGGKFNLERYKESYRTNLHMLPVYDLPLMSSFSELSDLYFQ